MRQERNEFVGRRMGVSKKMGRNVNRKNHVEQMMEEKGREM
jgi:hypothetical protein